jgi:L-arabinose isomerase
MTRSPKIGLLPLYLTLYDDRMPENRQEFEPFLKRVAAGFQNEGVEVESAPVCRLREEFERAVAQFEQADVDCIVTLHLAYSPSLESIDALTRTDLPIVMLDTTMDYGFGPDVDPQRLMHNHGIHGVMDLASVLRQRGKAFQIVAGHVGQSPVLARAALLARAAFAARSFRGTRALRVGDSFVGMGDFAVGEDVLQRAFGIRVDQVTSDDLGEAISGITREAVDEEMARDRERFTAKLEPAVHERSVRLGLGLRKHLADGGYHAFSMNFLAFDSPHPPLETIPFLEASKAMARGIGYAGEGDVLTASLVGALQRAFSRTTFTEVFCPDWQGDSLFLSHMGEINPEVAAVKPVLLEKPYPFGNALPPAFLACSPEPGPAVFVNLTPGPEETFRLIVAPVEVLPAAPQNDFRKSVHGWIRPGGGIGPFLETYSRLGGTHHSALVLGERTEAICAFASMSGLECCCMDL